MRTRVTTPAVNKYIWLGKYNRNNAIYVPTRLWTCKEIGVDVWESGPSKAVALTLVVPIRRSEVGSRRSATIDLNGHQARKIYEALHKFYTNRAAEEHANSYKNRVVPLGAASPYGFDLEGDLNSETSFGEEE